MLSTDYLIGAFLLLALVLQIALQRFPENEY